MKIAVTFQMKYRGDKDCLHSVFPAIRNYHYMVFQGATYFDVRQKAIDTLGSDFAFDYMYEDLFGLDPEFQDQIERHGLVLFVPAIKTKLEGS